MPSIKLKITATVPLGGKQPGTIFDVATDEQGILLDGYWRKRMREEDLYQVGAVVVLSDSPAPPSEPAPPAESASAASASSPSPTAPSKARKV